jgi:hypothetical protein
MRSTPLAVLALALVPAFSLACGGGTPPAADESAAKSDEKASAAPADSTAAASSAATTADTTPSSATTSAGATASQPPSTSADIKPSGDDPWLAAHQMPPKDVMKTMRAAQGKVQACFKAGLKRDPSTGGEVKLKFVITNDGGVRAWKDDASSMTDGEVTQCVGGVLNGLKFPKQKSPGDAWGTYSIHFGQ